MCCLPLTRFWTCCCERRTVKKGVTNGRDYRERKDRSNTRVRIASDRAASKPRTDHQSRTPKSKSRRSQNGASTVSEKHRSRGVDVPDGVYSTSEQQRSARKTSRHRSRTLDDYDTMAESRARRKNSDDGRSAPSRALNAAASTSTTTKDSKRRRAKSTGADHRESYLIGEKRNARRGSGGYTTNGARAAMHDDSGYKTEDRKPSKRPVATARNRRDVDFTDYYVPQSTGAHIPGEYTREEAETSGGILRKSGRRPTKNESSSRVGIVNMLDYDNNYNDDKKVRKSRHHATNAENSSSLRAGIVNMLDADLDYSGEEAAQNPRHRSTKSEDFPNSRAGVVNMLDGDINNNDDHDYNTGSKKKVSRSKSSGHRKSRVSHSDSRTTTRAITAAAIAAAATKTGADVLRRKSTRKKPIRMEDVDLSYRDWDVDSNDEYVASDDTYIDRPQKLTRSASHKIQKREKTIDTLTRSKSNKETSRTRSSHPRRQRKKESAQLAEPNNQEVPVPTKPLLTRQEAQAADPRSHRIEFSLNNLEQLAYEGLQRGINKRPPLLQSSAFASSSSSGPLEKSTFSYREDGPLPKSEVEYHTSLITHIMKQGLQTIIPASNSRLREIATVAPTRAPGISHSLHLSQYATPDLTKLGLYDVVVFCDDSASMDKEDRYDTLKTVVRRIARIASSYNPSGIKIRFINSPNDSGFNGVVTEDQVETCLDAVHLGYDTQLGTKLFEKVVNPLIVQRAKRGELIRPVIVSVITDGEPTGEHVDTLKRTILATKNELRNVSTASGGAYGASAVIFQIARVGTSSAAKKFVRSLEDDEEVSGLVFCTDESLDWALGEAEDSGALNTWLTQVMAGGIKR